MIHDNTNSPDWQYYHYTAIGQSRIGERPTVTSHSRILSAILHSPGSKVTQQWHSEWSICTNNPPYAQNTLICQRNHLVSEHMYERKGPGSYLRGHSNIAERAWKGGINPETQAVVSHTGIHAVITSTDLSLTRKTYINKGQCSLTTDTKIIVRYQHRLRERARHNCSWLFRKRVDSLEKK
jgi:hypothetical protein